MGLFSHNCSKCGTKCQIKSDGLFEGWWCPSCHQRKVDAKKIKELEERIRKLENK